MKSLPRERISPVVHPATKEALVLLRDITEKDFGELIDEAVARMAADVPGLSNTINLHLKKKAARMGFRWENEEIEVPVALKPKPRKALRLPAVQDKPMERWQRSRRPLLKPKDK